MVPRCHRYGWKRLDERLIQALPAVTSADHCEVAPVFVEPVELHDQWPRYAPVLVCTGQPCPRERCMLLALEAFRVSRWPAIRFSRVYAEKARFRAPLQAELKGVQQIDRVTVCGTIRASRRPQAVHLLLAPARVSML